MGNLWWPDYYVKSVVELTPTFFREQGISGLCLDVDCTITAYASNEIPSDVRQWIDHLRDMQFPLCLVSNAGRKRIGGVARQFGIPFVARALKPLPFGCRRALRLLQLPATQVAMVGDQMFADVLAGNWAGLKTILVVPREPEREPLVTRWKRPLERWLLRRNGVILPDGSAGQRRNTQQPRPGV